MGENPPSDKDIYEKLDDAIKALDEQRSEDLKKLRDLQAMMNRALEKERERLKEKFGSEHPRVKKIAARLAFNKGIQDDLEKLIVKTSIEARKHGSAFSTDDLKPISLDTDEGTSTDSQDVWIVQGAVIDEKDVGVGGLIVSLFDKDMLFDDILGSTITDKEGCFRIWYRTAAFRDLFEMKPDLYLKVTDHQGNTLYTSEEAVRHEAGRAETFKITIERRPDDSDDGDAPGTRKDD